MDFNFGVSIDHLIVPGILKKKRYFRKDGESWIQINENEFKNLYQLPGISILKSRKSGNQCKLFEEDNILVEETYLDEDERLRRYELTIQNAKEFIEGHKKGNFSFKPIGSVQGWDPDSYAAAIKDYQKMGYSYIALGDLLNQKLLKL